MENGGIGNGNVTWMNGNTTRPIQSMTLRPAAAVAKATSESLMLSLRSLMLFRLTMAAEREREREREKEKEGGEREARFIRTRFVCHLHHSPTIPEEPKLNRIRAVAVAVFPFNTRR